MIKEPLVWMYDSKGKPTSFTPDNAAEAVANPDCGYSMLQPRGTPEAEKAELDRQVAALPQQSKEEEPTEAEAHGERHRLPRARRTEPSDK